MTLQKDRTAIDTLSSGLAWNHTFAALGPAFSTRLQPTPLPSPGWVGQSDAVARLLGLDLDWFHSDDALQAFAGHRTLAGRAARKAARAARCIWGNPPAAPSGGIWPSARTVTHLRRHSFS